MKKLKKISKTPKAKAIKPKRVARMASSTPRIKKAKVYKIAITMNGETFRAKADSLFDALTQFKPTKITGKIVFNVQYNGLVVERMIFPHQARLIFNNEGAMDYFIKGFSVMYNIQ